MNEDLISRSALLESLKEQHDYIMQNPEVSKSMKWCEAVCFHRTVETAEAAPAVDAEKVFEQMGLVKEAIEMAKSSLVPVVRCENCVHQTIADCIRAMSDEELATFLSEWAERCLAWHGEYGETLAWLQEPVKVLKAEVTANIAGYAELAEAKPLTDFPDDADLEHMTRFAMQQALMLTKKE